MTVSSSTQQQPKSLQSYLRWRVPACLPGEPLVRRIVELTDVVWIVELEGNERVVAKHQVGGADTVDQPDDMLAVEPRILDLLVGEGCSVPRVLGFDPETCFIFYEYRGDRTVDDLCQQPLLPVDGRLDLGRQLVAKFCQIELTLTAHQRELQHMVTPRAQIEELPAVAARVEGGALEGLEKLRNLACAGATAETLDALTSEISQRLGARAPTLGSTDYNARNVVVGGGLRGGELLTFIEFARIGWDWPERRLVQYATSLGAGRPDGCFISLIGPDTANCYAQWGGGGDEEERAAALDGHHILFHLSAAAMLFRALDTPQLPRHRALLDAWRNPERRAAQIIEAISAPLTGDRRCSQFREMFASAMTHVSGRFGHE